MARAEANSLRDALAGASPHDAALLDAGRRASYADVLGTTILAGRKPELEGKSALICLASQFDTARALIELDGVASRLVICPPDFAPERLASAIDQAKVTALVCDPAAAGFGPEILRVEASPPIIEPMRHGAAVRATEWVLPTSGTTGAPKLVAHRLDALLGAIEPAGRRERPIVWGTFYDIRRYGGLQILLRAVTSRATLVLGESDEPLVAHVERLRAAGVTHVSGTPSHWRRLLMSGHANRIAPEYVRLSGEIADRAVLDALAAAYPAARVGHAYASTEAGVVFEVLDGQEGFPASFVDVEGEVELRVRDGSLRVRSKRTATRYVGADDVELADGDGFVDTGDLVERRGDRYHFKGRCAGVINIGGLKVHPEEVERIINLHEKVRISLVRARRNPIIGDLVVAEVVLKDVDAAATAERRGVLRDEILAICRARLERHQAPAAIEFVPSLELTASGKLARRHA